MAVKLIETAQERWRAVSARHLVAFVSARAASIEASRAVVALAAIVAAA